MKNPVSANRYRTIETEGDGYRSYVGICMALLLAVRPVALIDEPELCLHPPQAYHIGRFIGLHAKPKNHVTFVATHSSHVLKGIVDNADDNKLTILRLTRKEGEFRGHTIAEAELLACIRKPITRAEAVLDGLFSQAVILVESDGDREVYQAASGRLQVMRRWKSSSCRPEERAALRIQFGSIGGSIYRLR